jgi:chemotaxis methyl-accepting protein methylase
MSNRCVAPGGPGPGFTPATPPGGDDPEEFRRLVAKIEAERQFQGRFYKDKCLRRRLEVRMRARGEDSFAGYATLLDDDPAEYEALLDALTINVTKFFRNAEVWVAVREKVTPHLFEGRDGERSIWSAGCASGEEPYTLSMLLREWAESNDRTGEMGRFRILGTDIDRRSLETARRAEYSELSLSETPPEERARWFTESLPYRLAPCIREPVEFARRDLISDDPEPEQSLILCRNVIIYLDREIQEELFMRFYDALVPGGFLVLGKVETLLGRARTLFRPVSPRERIFRKPE